MVKMTSYNTPVPYVVDYSSDGGSGPTTEAWQAFAGDDARAWVSGVTGPHWIQLDWGSGGARSLRSYQMYCPDGLFASLNPNSWDIEGADDPISWDPSPPPGTPEPILLSRVTGMTLALWSAQPRRNFLYTNALTVAFRYTRLTVTALNSGDPRVTINEWVVSLLGNANRLY